jgi:hypothetical protein
MKKPRKLKITPRTKLPEAPSPLVPAMDDAPVAPITVTVATACAVSGLGPTTMWSLIGQKKVEAVRIGRRTLIVWASLQRLLTPQPETVAEAAE